MRGGFRRGRFDKVPQPGSVSSYSEAVYPSRVYHYYTQQSSAAVSSTAMIIIPSIDDGVDDFRARESHPQGGVSSVMDKRAPPLLRDFVDCFIDGSQCIPNSRAFSVLESGKEPLNILHYPTLLGINKELADTESLVTNKKNTQTGGTGDPQVRVWEGSLGLPPDLRFYGLTNPNAGDMPIAALDRLRIRAVKRKRILKPKRHGAKVLAVPLSGSEDTQERKRLRRDMGGDEELEGGKKAQVKHDNDDQEEEGSAGYDKEDDEASLSYQVDDDDDGGDLDGPEGSVGEDDFF